MTDIIALLGFRNSGLDCWSQPSAMPFLSTAGRPDVRSRVSPLPRRNRADDGERVPAKSPPADGPLFPLLRVIIVDDHPSFRSMAARILTSGGFTVIGEEADGCTGLVAAQRLRPDLVLLDVQLPDIDGFQVADALAAAARAAQMMPPSVVLMSSRAKCRLRVACCGGPGDRVHRQGGPERVRCALLG